MISRQRDWTARPESFEKSEVQRAQCSSRCSHSTFQCPTPYLFGPERKLVRAANSALFVISGLIVSTVCPSTA